MSRLVCDTSPTRQFWCCAFCPKGPNNSAQGNALGLPANRDGTTISSNQQALKGRHKWRTPAMSQSLVRNLIHLVYSTKQRRPWISKAHRDSLFAYQAGIYKEWDSPAIVIGGVEDHVHALFALSKNHPLIRRSSRK